MRKFILIFIIVTVLFLSGCSTLAGNKGLTTIEGAFIEKTELYDKGMHYYAYSVGHHDLLILAEKDQPEWIVGHGYRVTYKVDHWMTEVADWEEIK